MCSYWPTVRPIWENIRTAVLKYGSNGVRSVKKTKVRILSRVNRTNWSIKALLNRHNQRPKPSLNSELNIFVSSLNAAIGREIFSNSSLWFKVKLSFKKTKTCVKMLSSILFVYWSRPSISWFNMPFLQTANEPIKSRVSIWLYNNGEYDPKVSILDKVWL